MLTRSFSPQDQAISTFNFLNNEDRYVGLAVIPPETTETFQEEHELIRKRQQRRELLEPDPPLAQTIKDMDKFIQLPTEEKTSELPLKEDDWKFKKWGPPRQ